MAETELRTVLEVASPQKARGIILGQTDRGSVICLPEDTRLNKHIAVFGASGTMKSRGVIRPALFQSIRRGESVVVTDPKSEIYSDTVELFRKYGYTVRVYNLLQPELSDSWNCMFDLGGDTLMAQVLTDVIIANTKGDGKGDHFWDNGEANLLKSLSSMWIWTPHAVQRSGTCLPSTRCLPRTRRSSSPLSLTGCLWTIRPGHPTACSARPAIPCGPVWSWAWVPGCRCCGGWTPPPTTSLDSACW